MGTMETIRERSRATRQDDIHRASQIPGEDVLTSSINVPVLGQIPVWILAAAGIGLVAVLGVAGGASGGGGGQNGSQNITIT